MTRSYRVVQLAPDSKPSRLSLSDSCYRFVPPCWLVLEFSSLSSLALGAEAWKGQAVTVLDSSVGVDCGLKKEVINSDSWFWRCPVALEKKNRFVFVNMDFQDIGWLGSEVTKTTLRPVT